MPASPDAWAVAQSRRRRCARVIADPGELLFAPIETIVLVIGRKRPVPDLSCLHGRRE
jgi:hypothetical protein